MDGKEDEHLEFKEAKNRYDFEELVDYCVALANERGGKMILGVTNKKPRKVVGTKAFSTLEKTKNGLYERLHFRVEIHELNHPDGRVLVFDVPSRPIGHAIEYKGAYWMRAGESLVPMSPDRIKKIFDEATPDYSAKICEKASLEDLDSSAIQWFREKWAEAAKNPALLRLPDAPLLRDTNLVTDEGVTIAALILFGKEQALSRFLPQAEVIFEYRSNDASIAFQDRKEYRAGFLLFLDELWKTINLRNDKFHYVEGLFDVYIPAFQEEVFREALLNAVSHRDYRLGSSIFVKQYQQKLEIISPGTFPDGVTPENILWQQKPRNRLVAENLQRCGLIQRSGQGADRMFEEMIKSGKRSPDYSSSDDHQVWLILYGEVQDSRFLKFLQKVGQGTLARFDALDLYALDLIHREQPIPSHVRERISKLLSAGVIEPVGHGRGRRYILSKRFYDFLGQSGVYTRTKGLDRETNKELLLKHIRDNASHGSPLEELIQVLPSHTRRQVQGILKNLRDKGYVCLVGKTKKARWFPAPVEKQ
jgi:ATP-dependent DNA helicase RecG